MAQWAMAGGQLINTGLDFLKSQQQMGIEQQKIAEARRNADMQAYLTQRGMNLQEQMAKAGQRDVYGNQVIFDPNTNQWVTLTSPQGQALINRSDAIQRMMDVRNIGQEGERDLAQQRRLAAGEGANALITQLNRGYGAPTREGVAGTNAVAAVTGASEPLDEARRAVTGAALRTGGNVTGMEGIERSGLAGVRTALAGSQAQASPLYSEMMTNWRGSLLNPTSSLTGLATAPDVNFTPSNIPTTLDSAMTNRAVNAKAWNPYTGYTSNEANKQLLSAMGGLKAPDWGGMGSSLTKSIYDLGKSEGWWGGDKAKNLYPSGSNAYWGRVKDVSDESGL